MSKMLPKNRKKHIQQKNKMIIFVQTPTFVMSEHPIYYKKRPKFWTGNCPELKETVLISHIVRQKHSIKP